MFDALKDALSADKMRQGQPPQTYATDIVSILELQEKAQAAGKLEINQTTDIRPDVVALGQVVYGLYLRIFENCTALDDHGDCHDPLYATRRAVTQLIDGGLIGLLSSRDGMLKDWAARQRGGLETDADYAKLMRELPTLAARAGLLHLFPTTMFYLVLAVYSDGERTYWTAPDDTMVDVYLPGKLTGYTRYPWRLRKISSVGIPRQMPRFWRWLTILFYEQIIEQTVPAHHTLFDDLRAWYALLALAARPLAITEWRLNNALSMPVRRTTANLVAALHIGDRLDWESFGDRSVQSRHSARTEVVRYLANALMNTPCQWVDEAITKAFFTSLVAAHEQTKPEAVYQAEEQTALQTHPTAQLFVLMRQAREGLIQPRLFAGLEAQGDTEADTKTPDDHPDLPDGDDEVKLSDDEDSSAPDDAAAIDDDNSPPTKEEDENNYMASPGDASARPASTLIALATGDEGLDAFIYRMAVLRASEEIEQRPELGVDPSASAALKDWCLRWLWLTEVTSTKEVVSSLGLDRIFKALISEESKR